MVFTRGHRGKTFAGVSKLGGGMCSTQMPFDSLGIIFEMPGPLCGMCNDAISVKVESDRASCYVCTHELRCY
jgi:hypothetical protein